MSTAAASVVVFAMAGALSFVLPQRLRWLLVVAVLVVPIALATPSFVRAEQQQAGIRSAQFAPPPPFYMPEISPALIGGIVANVPPHASITMVNGDFETGWARWLAYEIAPRQLVTKSTTWTIVIGETPKKAGLFPMGSWHYGANWLVER